MCLLLCKLNTHSRTVFLSLGVRVGLLLCTSLCVLFPFLPISCPGVGKSCLASALSEISSNPLEAPGIPTAGVRSDYVPPFAACCLQFGGSQPRLSLPSQVLFCAVSCCVIFLLLSHVVVVVSCCCPVLSSCVNLSHTVFLVVNIVPSF